MVVFLKCVNKACELHDNEHGYVNDMSLRTKTIQISYGDEGILCYCQNCGALFHKSHIEITGTGDGECI